MEQKTKEKVLGEASNKLKELQNKRNKMNREISSLKKLETMLPKMTEKQEQEFLYYWDIKILSETSE